MRIGLVCSALIAASGLELRLAPESLQPALVSTGHIAAAPNATGALCVGADCDCPHGCSSNGECINGECKCYAGFTYYDCSLKVCPSDCSGNGFCYNATCHCHPGWRGGDCSLRSCPNECNYHGVCKAGKCQCRGGWK